jgi:hypothetical protein
MSMQAPCEGSGPTTATVTSQANPAVARRWR